MPLPLLGGGWEG
ncbi:hypothetical protein VCHC55C2_2570A, partial [Vibrio cholerae HC-55C2]